MQVVDGGADFMGIDPRSEIVPRESYRRALVTLVRIYLPTKIHRVLEDSFDIQAVAR